MPSAEIEAHRPALRTVAFLSVFALLGCGSAATQ
jgi:hypothetical protein